MAAVKMKWNERVKVRKEELICSADLRTGDPSHGGRLTNDLSRSYAICRVLIVQRYSE